MTDPDDATELLRAVPYLAARAGDIVGVSPAVAGELGCDPDALRGPLDRIGTRLDDVSFDDVLAGVDTLRVRLRSELGDRPIRLRRLGEIGEVVWLEVRSLAAEFRLESLLRRSGMGHMLLSPTAELLWSISGNDLAEVFPGDDPRAWIQLMDPDDLLALGEAIREVGADPAARRVVQHRLRADRTHTIIDVVESAVHDPDLRGVLVRSRLATTAITELASSAASFVGHSVSDHMPIGVVVATASGAVLHRNAAAAELLGARLGLPVTADIESGSTEPWLLSGSEADQVDDYIAAFRAAVSGSSASCSIMSPTVPDRWLRVSISPSSASIVVITVEDATELVEAERAVRASNRLLEALDSHAEDLVIVFDADGVSRYASNSLRRLGATASVEHVRDVLALIEERDRDSVLDLVGSVESQPGSSASVEVRLGIGGTERWHQASATNLLDDPDVEGVVVTLRDIHERHLIEGELRFRAMHDPLTTLPDRSTFQQRLDGILGDGSPETFVALLFCDIDHFKSVNDEYGHQVGDEVLIRVARRLVGAARERDVVARFGGDEFVVVFAGVDGLAHGRALAEQVVAAASGPVLAGDDLVEVTLSAGLAVSATGATTAGRLVRDADLAMYRAKQAGRAQLVILGTAVTDVVGPDHRPEPG